MGGATDTTGYSPTSNRIAGTTGTSPQSYGYDALGNITTLGSATAYQYDAFNRLSAAGGMSYYVNPEGQRLRKSGGAGTTYFAPDASGTLLAEYLNGRWIDYVWLGGRLIGREVNGPLEAIGDDQLGRPQVVTNAAQTVVWKAQNWPFSSGPVISNSAPLNLGFPGQYYDAETGLWNNGFRDYDPTLGRYVESDPTGLAGGVNTYAYVLGNPLDYTDPYGLGVFAGGVSGTFGRVWGVAGGAGIIADGSGNVAIYYSSGEGFAGGQSVGVNGSFFGSTGDDTTTINDFAGPFGNVSIPYVEGYVDPNNPQHVGAGVNYGLGGSAFVGCTDTKIKKIGNINDIDLLDYVARRVFGGQWPGLPKWAF